MNIIVYDDDVRFIDFMKESLEKLNSKHNGILGTPSYYSEAKDIMHYAVSNKDNPSIFILDIMADDKQIGYMLADGIKKLNSENLVIHVTDYKMQVFENEIIHRINTFGFVLKGSSKFLSELETAILKARNSFKSLFFVAKTGKTVIKIRLEDIYYFEKKKNTDSVTIYHKNGSDTYRENLIYIKNKLSNHFCYAAKESIVNTQAITRIDKINKIIYFGDNVKCLYSKNHKRELLKWILQ